MVWFLEFNAAWIASFCDSTPVITAFDSLDTSIAFNRTNTLSIKSERLTVAFFNMSVCVEEYEILKEIIKERMCSYIIEIKGCIEKKYKWNWKISGYTECQLKRFKIRI